MAFSLRIHRTTEDDAESRAARPAGFPPWSLFLGRNNRDPLRVYAKENWQRGGKVAIITFPYPDDPGKRKTENTGLTVRTATGKIDRKRERHIEILMDEARRQLVAPRDAADAPDVPLTIGDTADILKNAKTGPLVTKSKGYADEVLRHLAFAVNTWGDARAWNTIKRADWTALGRAAVDAFAERRDASTRHRRSANNARDKGGYDTAVKVVKRVQTVARWLEDNEHIDPGASAAPKEWLDDLKEYWKRKHLAVAIPAPDAPRHTLADFRRLLAAMPAVDPRGYLLLQLGAEQRSGQVLRSRRSDVDLRETPDAPHGVVTVHGVGKKRAAAIVLTKGQRSALESALTQGYLRFYEQARIAGELADYPLFPDGKLRRLTKKNYGTADNRKPVEPYCPTPNMADSDQWGYQARKREPKVIDRKRVRAWLVKAETIANIPHVRGRAWYGLRRVGVDETLDRTDDPRVLKEMGGWATTVVPQTIYADQQNKGARKKAMEIRAAMRGEEPTQ